MLGEKERNTGGQILAVCFLSGDRANTQNRHKWRPAGHTHTHTLGDSQLLHAVPCAIALTVGGIASRFS